MDRIRSAIEAKAEFNSGFVLPGRAEHEAYLDRLVTDFSDVGVELERQAFEFTKWEPTDWSLQLTGDSTQDIDIASYMPFSGFTDAAGRERELVYLDDVSIDGTTVTLDGDPFADALDPSTVDEKHVVVELPVPKIPLGALEERYHLLREETAPFPDVFDKPLFTALLSMPQIVHPLSEANAAGVVGIHPYGSDVADNLYAPFEGEVIGTPAVYLDNETGETVLEAIEASGDTPPRARLTLAGTVDEAATGHNLVGEIPGASDDVVVLSTHTDGTNIYEENGPAALLALAEYYGSIPQNRRPVTLRLFLAGAHMAGNAGLKQYTATNKDAIKENVLAAIEVEHLGALAWNERQDGSFGLTGEIEPQFLYVTDDAPVVEASIGFGKQFDRIAVVPASVLYFGAGDQWMGLTGLSQYITGANYLLNHHVDVDGGVSSLLDYDLARKQITAFAQMILELGNTPPEQFD